MKKKINIIGAGIAGLSAGCYLQMNGYETEIFEMHNIPGGLCTSWKRGNYTFDGCVHWLVGSSPKDGFYKQWNNLIDMKSIKFIDHDVYARFYNNEGNFIDVFTDVNLLEKELLAKAPEDEKLILEFTNAIRKFIPFKNNMEFANEVMGI